MKRHKTLDEWKQIVEEFDANYETQCAYCKRIGVSQSSFKVYKKRVFQNLNKSNDAFLPVHVTRESKISVSVNGIHFEVDTSIDDISLKRIIRLCAEI